MITQHVTQRANAEDGHLWMLASFAIAAALILGLVGAAILLWLLKYVGVFMLGPVLGLCLGAVEQLLLRQYVAVRQWWWVSALAVLTAELLFMGSGAGWMGSLGDPLDQNPSLGQWLFLLLGLPIAGALIGGTQALLLHDVVSAIWHWTLINAMAFAIAGSGALLVFQALMALAHGDAFDRLAWLFVSLPMGLLVGAVLFGVILGRGLAWVVRDEQMDGAHGAAKSL